MRATALAVLCALSTLAVPNLARAGDLYGDGYGRSGHHRVWYSTDCCFKKVIRHEESSRLVRIDSGYDDGYRSSYGRDRYYGVPRYAVSEYSYGPRYTYDRDYGYRTRYSDYDDYAYRPRYRAYSTYAAFEQRCYTRRTPIADAWGGWVWGKERVCY